MGVGPKQDTTPRINEAIRPAIATNHHVSQIMSQTAKGSSMKKKVKKKAAPKKGPRKDAAQSALSIVERVTGGKLKR